MSEPDINTMMDMALAATKAREAQELRELRDKFAGQALGGLLAADPQKPETVSPKQAFEDLARVAYALADAMLAARERKP